jgi:hypothetical protein
MNGLGRFCYGFPFADGQNPFGNETARSRPHHMNPQYPPGIFVPDDSIFEVIPHPFPKFMVWNLYFRSVGIIYSIL